MHVCAILLFSQIKIKHHRNISIRLGFTQTQDVLIYTSILEVYSEHRIGLNGLYVKYS